MKIIFIFSCSGMFRDVPECSGMFRHVPECSVFRILSTAKKITCRCQSNPFLFRNLTVINFHDNYSKLLLVNSDDRKSKSINNSGVPSVSLGQSINAFT